MNTEKLDEITTSKLKAIELDLLEVFIKSCHDLNLKYYVIGGTLLGAVRHKGFIPWDDDIDVAMPRQDYEKWIKIAQKKNLGNKYFIQTFKSDPEYPGNYAKLRNCETTFIEKNVRKLDINHGVFIDIFPLDYYPTKKTNQFKILKFLYTCKISLVFDLDATSYSPLKKYIRKICGFIIPGTSFDAVKKRERLYKKNPKSIYMANFSGAWGKKEIVPAKWYGEGTTLSFEGITVSAPKEYKKWLTQVYGDYMSLPPIEKRVTHHYTEVIDLDRSYKNYRK